MNRRGFLKFFGVSAPVAAAASVLPEIKPPHPVALVKRTLGEFELPDGSRVMFNEYVIRMSDGTEIDKFVGVPPGLPYTEEGPPADAEARLVQARAELMKNYNARRAL